MAFCSGNLILESHFIYMWKSLRVIDTNTNINHDTKQQPSSFMQENISESSSF